MRGRALIPAVAVAQVFFSGAARAENPRPAPLQNVSIEQRLNEQVPLDLVFRDENGQSVQLAQYFGRKPVILSLVYYECPMLCTLVLNGLTAALDVLSFNVGKEFEVVTVSFSPTETPELATAKKHTYLKRYGRPGAEAGWHFLTGDQPAIEALTRAVGFQYTYDPALKQYAHAAAIMILTPQGRISRYFFGVEYAPKDVRLGLVEASQNRIGSLVDQLLLFCYHYDPVAGRYSAVAVNIIRAGGVVTVVALASFMIVMFRRDARRKRRLRAVLGPNAAESPVTSTSPH
ncbi:MAG TPA: SCO family protein [Candidatus Binatia bacterium]|nr:SCO family protein [Candidatus Binatia bacterium]